MAEGYHLKAGVFWVKYGTRNKGAVKKEKNTYPWMGFFLSEIVIKSPVFPFLNEFLVRWDDAGDNRLEI